MTPQTVFASNGVPSVLINIAKCESGITQFNADGSPVKNAQSGAVGVFQLLPSYHEPIAKKMGLDIYKTQDNIEYAIWLYNQDGTAPWLASKLCWGAGDTS